MKTVRGRLALWVCVVALATGVGSALAYAAPDISQPSQPKGDSESALRVDIDRLKQEVEALRSELRLMREFLLQRLAQPQQSARPVKVAIGDDPALGRMDAPVTLIEFSDYQCPYCRRFFETTFPGLKKEYVDTGKLRYVFHDFPADQSHPFARKAAEAARCAGDHGKYWEMHNLLFRNQEALHRDDLIGYAKQLSLDENVFKSCLDRGQHESAVQQDFRAGVSAGVRGTPTFLLGKTGSDHTVEAILITGAPPLDEFRRAIERLLGAK